MIVAVVGLPASGKTTLARALAVELGARVLSVDDYPGRGSERWDTLLRDVATSATSATSPLIVESCAAPTAYQLLLNRTPHLVVETVAPHGVRLRRLVDRGLLRWQVERMMRRQTDYARLRASVTVDGTADVTEAARRIRDLLREAL